MSISGKDCADSVAVQRANALLSAGLDDLKAGNTSVALRRIDEARALGVSVRDMEFARALCYCELNQPGAAIIALRQEIANFPDNAQAREFLTGLEKDLPATAPTPVSAPSPASATIVQSSVDLHTLGNPLVSQDSSAATQMLQNAISENPLKALKNFTGLSIESNQQIADVIIQVLVNAPNPAPADIKEFAKVARDLLKNNPALFTTFYQRLIDAPAPARQRSRYTPQGAEIPQVERIVTELKRDGISFWRGMYADPGLLAELQRVSNASVDFARQALGELDNKHKDVAWPEMGCVPKLFKCNQVGRYRCSFLHNSLPRHQALQAIAHDPRVSEIAERYSNGNVNFSYMMAEWLQPAEKGDDWHVDSLQDDFKMMILLTDVEQDHGPIRAMLGTKNNLDVMGPTLFATFANGLNYAYPSYSLMRNFKFDTIYGTGKAGDAIFFDVGAIHSGTACVKDHRLVLVTRHQVDNVKNRVLGHLWSIG